MRLAQSQELYSSSVFEAQRVWSLFDMMRYGVHDLHALLLWIDHMCNYTYGQENQRSGVDAQLNAGETLTVRLQLRCIQKHMVQLELHEALGACNELGISLEQHPSLGECRGQLLSLRRMLTDALTSRIFMYIPQAVSKYANSQQTPITDIRKADLVTNPLAGQPFGIKVFTAFKDARKDAQQIALCLVAGASTAAVFHMMRVVEHGVRELGRELGLRKIKEVSKTGKVKLVPIENVTWDRLHVQIRGKIDRRLSKLRPGPAKDRKEAYYSSLLHDFQGFKEAWRNHVMHSRAHYGPDEAENVMSHVERFMKAVAETVDAQPHSVGSPPA